MMLLGLLLLAAMLATNFAVLVGARLLVGRAFGIPLNLFSRRPAIRIKGISRWARPAVFVSCATGTYLVAASLFFAALLIGGEDRWTDHTIITVLEGHPAQAAGMLTGDRVLAIAGTKLDSFKAMSTAIKAHPGEPIDVVVERAGVALHLTVTPGAKGMANEGKIGIAQQPKHLDLPVGEALLRGVQRPASVLAAIVKGFFAIFRGSVEGELGGPVAVAQATATAARSGAASTLEFLGALNAYFWPGFCVLSLFLLPSRRKKEPS